MYTMVLMAAMSGGADMPDCHRNRGCCGCYGGGYSNYSGGCYGRSYGGGCYGGGVSYYGGGCYGSGGAYYGDGYYGGGNYGGYPYRTMPPVRTGEKGEKIPPPKKGDGGEEQSQPRNRDQDLPPPETSARLTVNVPADATVFIDERPTTTTSGERSFATPSLEKGYRYYYTVRAEVVRNGAVFTGTQRVSFTAGDQVRVNISERDMTSTAVAQPVGQ